MKKFAFLIFPTLFCASLLAQQLTSTTVPASLPTQAPASATGDSTVVEEIVARINNSIITRADLRKSRDAMVSEVRQQNTTGADQEIKDRDKDVLRDLIDQQLLVQKAAELDINADTEVIKRLDEIRKQMHAESMEDVEKAAVAQGVSFEEFKQNLKNSILTQRVISQEVGGHINVTQQEMQQYYDSHKAQMDRPEQVRLSEILIATSKTPPIKTEKGETALPEAPDPEDVAKAQAKAEQVYAMLKKGSKFDDLAKQYSDGPTASLGGDLEYFKRGTLSKQLEDQTFGMKAGDFTEPVRTNQGFVILKVTEHQNAGIPPRRKSKARSRNRFTCRRCSRPCAIT